MGGISLADYLWILGPLVLILSAHLALLVVLGKRIAWPNSLWWLGGLAFATSVMWFLISAGLLLIFSFCSRCWTGTPEEQLYKTTLGLPFRLCDTLFELSPN